MRDTDRRYSREEFRQWVERQPKGRFERIYGRIVAVAPARAAHLRVKGEVYKALDWALAEGATVETGDSDDEPDALVNCGQAMPDDVIVAPNPVVVVEVLSYGTTSTDTGGKLVGYFQVPSVSHYLIVHPTKRVITHHLRTEIGIDTRIIVNGPIVFDSGIQRFPDRPRRSRTHERPHRLGRTPSHAEHASPQRSNGAFKQLGCVRNRRAAPWQRTPPLAPRVCTTAVIAQSGPKRPLPMRQRQNIQEVLWAVIDTVPFVVQRRFGQEIL